MYTLRIITETMNSGQVIENFELGSSYVLIKDLSNEFNRVIDESYPEVDKSITKAILWGENKRHFFLEYDSKTCRKSYFIMTESGQTFQKI